MNITLWIPGKVPSMNELLYSKSVTSSKSDKWLLTRGKKKPAATWNEYNEIKRQWKSKVAKLVKQQAITQKFDSYYIHYEVIEENERRDPDNFCFSAVKFINDGLVSAGVLAGDGRANVKGMSFSWRTDKNSPGIYVTIKDFLHPDTR